MALLGQKTYANTIYWPERILTTFQLIEFLTNPYRQYLSQTYERYTRYNRAGGVEFASGLSGDRPYFFQLSAKATPGEGLTLFKITERRGGKDQLVLNVQDQEFFQDQALEDLLTWNISKYFSKGRAAFSWRNKKFLIRHNQNGNKSFFEYRQEGRIHLRWEDKQTDIGRELRLIVSCQCGIPNAEYAVVADSRIDRMPRFFQKSRRSTDSSKKGQVIEFTEIAPVVFFQRYQQIVLELQKQFNNWLGQIKRASAWPQ
jgi:hypothetical protein